MNAAAPPPIAPANPLFDLSLLPNSDGRGPQLLAGHGYVQIAGNQDPQAPHYLTQLSDKYSTAYGGNLQFTGLPYGYTLWWKAKTGQINKNGTPVGAFYVYGHPNGCFASVTTFIVHLHNMINNIAGCQCVKCR